MNFSGIIWKMNVTTWDGIRRYGMVYYKRRRCLVSWTRLRSRRWSMVGDNGFMILHLQRPCFHQIQRAWKDVRWCYIKWQMHVHHSFLTSSSLRRPALLRQTQWDSEWPLLIPPQLLLIKPSMLFHHLGQGPYDPRFWEITIQLPTCSNNCLTSYEIRMSDDGYERWELHAIFGL